MMKKILGLALAGIVAVGVTSSFAGGCCMGEKAGVCADAFSKLKLTDHQKTELTTLQQQCKNAVSTSESRQMMADGLAKILTPDQLSQWNVLKAADDKADKSGNCPFMKAHAGCASKS